MNEEEQNHITEILADDYELDDIEKAIDDVMQSYEKERLVNRKIEIIEKLENNNETIDQEEKNKLEKELTDIIIRVAKMK